MTPEDEAMVAEIKHRKAREEASRLTREHIAYVEANVVVETLDLTDEAWAYYAPEWAGAA